MYNCIVCGLKLSPIFSLGMQPLANKYPKTEIEKNNEFKSEMNVYFCSDCGYVNVPCSVDRSVFFEDYYYLSSVNKELTNHFKDLAEEIHLSEFKFVVDVGSNDGILLRHLKDKDVKFLGVDPSENVSKIANDSGLTTVVGFFDQPMVEKIIDEFGRPDLVVASSVFTHLENPLDFFDNVKSLLKKDGRLIIEVEYLKNIISDFAFERFYFDRPHYYSLKSLIKMGGQHGFSLEDARLINVHGGSLRVTFKLGVLDNLKENVKELLYNENLSIDYSNFLAKFNNFKISCSALKSALYSFKNRGLTVAAYGCPARFSTITNFAKITNEDLPFVVDDSKLKQNRFSPGMHVPIIKYSNEVKPDVFIVFAFEYIESIKEKVGILTEGYFRPVPFLKI